MLSKRYPCGGGYLGDGQAPAKSRRSSAGSIRDGGEGYHELAARESLQQQAHGVGAPLVAKGAMATVEEQHVGDAKRGQDTSAA